jgi:polyketide biosynthesis 3-hydroxy-3-methylglutaryl-CoA synthase-like enzyme PksG
MNVFGGCAVLQVDELAAHRQLDRSRFENLLMKEKTVPLPFEDPVTFGATAAWPIVAGLSPAERDRIELLITCSESGIDFGKSMSTYIHHYLGLSRGCRLFEIKQACYSGTAGLQMAASFVLSQTSPGARALVIATDVSNFVLAGQGETPSGDGSFVEPSSGAGAVAMLVSEQPDVFELDIGANGYYGYEVMDTCRPRPDTEEGNSDLSLLSYLDCCEASFKEYVKRVVDADYGSSFDYLVFHTPFGGMVKGAHRSMMRKLCRATPGAIQLDFERRVQPGLQYCQRVGNIMGGMVFLALASAIVHGDVEPARRVGCFSYGSGCCSEFYSGVVTAAGQAKLRAARIGRYLDERYPLSMAEYDSLFQSGGAIRFGTRNLTLDPDFMRGPRQAAVAEKRLFLTAIRDFHREYAWVE